MLRAVGKVIRGWIIGSEDRSLRIHWLELEIDLDTIYHHRRLAAPQAVHANNGIAQLALFTPVLEIRIAYSQATFPTLRVVARVIDFDK